MFKRLARAWRSAKRRLGPKVGRHRLVGETTRGGLRVVEIARDETLAIKIDATSDTGYHRFGNDWWLQPRCPHSFKSVSYTHLTLPTILRV